MIEKDPIWTTSLEKNLKFVVSWEFEDPENCIVGIESERGRDNYFFWRFDGSDKIYFPTFWTVARAGEKALVSAETEFPISLLESLTPRKTSPLDYYSQYLQEKFAVRAELRTRMGSGYSTRSVRGEYGVPQLWGTWFSKNQGISTEQCQPISASITGKEIDSLGDMPILNSKITWKILNPGIKPTVEISIREDSNCIFLVHAGPLKTPLGLNAYSNKGNSLAEHPFWSEESPAYFNEILSNSDQLVQVAVGDFTGSRFCFPCKPVINYHSDVDLVKTLPTEILSHSDLVSRDGSTVKISATIDGTKISTNSADVITIYTGFYWWFVSTELRAGGAGWRVTFSGNSWTARYSRGASAPRGKFMGYTARAIKIPANQLFVSAADKAAADKAAADKAAAEAEAAADKLLAEAKAEADRILAAAKAVANKKITITCVKGKLTKKVTAVKPKCPSGYKAKK